MEEMAGIRKAALKAAFYLNTKSEIKNANSNYF